VLNPHQLVMKDALNRPMRDLRISLIDQCNMRCRYCMPAEVFGPDYPFLSRKQLLSFSEIVRIVKASEPLGVKKIRLTGGEPLLRRGIEDVIQQISSETSIVDIALTTNGLRLPQKAALLKSKGLVRVNLSFDALDPEVFHQMSGGYGALSQVLEALDACLETGLEVKINTVVKRGVNDGEIVELLALGIERGVEVRFIEYMDVGLSNGWQRKHVFTESEMLKKISAAFGVPEALPVDPMAVSRGYVLPEQNDYKWGVIASVTRPFCGGCVRARVSADGKLYTCLFSNHGHDLRPFLQTTSGISELQKRIAGLWAGRSDQYSQLRNTADTISDRVEMSYIGG
jgi:cyclic pyranopterin phosphate synthase